MDIIKCKKCAKEYAYEVCGTAYPGGSERETARCPYCGEEGYSEMTSQSIRVYKIDSQGNIKRY
jgi:DNA-directed RNA polymerase subunit RPC12/RpoP